MLFYFLHFKLCLIKMRSRLSRCSTAWGSRFLINWGGPTKEGASKSFLVVESSLVVKIMNNCLIFYSKRVSIAQRSTRQARLLVPALSILSIYLRTVDLIYVGVDSVMLYKLRYYSIHNKFCITSK